MKTLYIIPVLLLITNLLFSQDLHLSQYQEAKLLFNPALTGDYDGEYRVHLQHRSQWRSVLKNPYKTEFFSFDKSFKRKLKRLHLGIYALNYRAGVGKFNFLNIMASGSYEVTIDPSNTQHLIFGTQLGMAQNSFDINSLTFDNQFTSAYGGSFDQSINSGETFEKTSIIKPDVNFGLHYVYQNRFNYFNYSVYKKSTYNPYAGVVAYHLTQPSLTFSEFKNKLYRRYFMYAGCKIKVSIPFCVEPSFIYMRQRNINEFQISTTTYYYEDKYNFYAFTSLNLRPKDAFIITLGAIYLNYRIGVSYDINTSRLRAITNSKGGFEISLTYTKIDNKTYPMF
ncbi:MAG: hypothetical protein A2046_05175 [Bacteroidetes bacterium GWA2_30_7]|nr:MAG: hypothetical protein A2046_05175 [Bacteroidetes bacterium GWA2_30_7]